MYEEYRLYDWVDIFLLRLELYDPVANLPAGESLKTMLSLG